MLWEMIFILTSVTSFVVSALNPGNDPISHDLSKSFNVACLEMTEASTSEEQRSS